MADVLLVNATGAAERLGISRSHFYAMARADKIGPVPIRLGNRTLYELESLRGWVRAGCPPRTEWLKDDGKE